MNKHKRQVLQYILPPLITLILVSISLCVEGVFPFGSKTIDYYDMGQQIAAFYYHVYDALHGTKSLFYDWYSALGTNMTMNTSGCSSISIFNLLLYFVPRDSILQALSLFTMIKMACMSFTMYIYLNKVMKADYLWKLTFSVGYGFCGFALMYYITNQWLDVAVLLPLVMYGLLRLIHEKKTKMYLICLALCFMGSYYQTAMIVIFIILFTGLYLLLEEMEKQERNAVIWRLMLSSFAALLLSAYVVIPQLVQTLNSTRFSNNVKEGNFYLNILSQVRGAYTTRWWALLGLSLAFAVIVTSIFRKLRKKQITRRELLIGIMMIFLCLELFLESTNLLMHFGSYVGYPIRNGFIISFFVLSSACYYAQDLPISVDRQKLKLKLPLGIIMGILITSGLIIYYQSRGALPLRQAFHITFAVCAATFVIYLFLIRKPGIMMVFLLFSELIFFSVLLLGKPQFITGYAEGAEQSGEYIHTTNVLVDELQIESSKFHRIKNPDTDLNANYPFVMKRSALSNWTHIISPLFQYGAADWGYSIQYMRMLDAGGTVFSDALLGITETLTLSSLPKELYEPVDQTLVKSEGKEKPYTLYKNRYVMPFGVILKDADPFSFDAAEQGRFETQNEVYKLLAKDKEQNLIELLSQGNGGDVLETYEVKGRKVLYFTGDTISKDEKNIRITVNGNPVLIPSIGEPDNEWYPAYFNCNMICLGVFEDEKVEVSLEFRDIPKEERTEHDEVYQIASLDLDLLEQLCTQYQTMGQVNDPIMQDTS
ncbi:MAG: YfhO family protein, partial [Clostridia bacterium]|nr:YfhO family protein [Clostridia bacterium]